MERKTLKLRAHDTVGVVDSPEWAFSATNIESFKRVIFTAKDPHSMYWSVAMPNAPPFVTLTNSSAASA